MSTINYNNKSLIEKNDNKFIFKNFEQNKWQTKREISAFLKKGKRICNSALKLAIESDVNIQLLEKKALLKSNSSSIITPTVIIQKKNIKDLNALNPFELKENRTIFQKYYDMKNITNEFIEKRKNDKLMQKRNKLFSGYIHHKYSSINNNNIFKDNFFITNLISNKDKDKDNNNIRKLNKSKSSFIQRSISVNKKKEKIQNILNSAQENENDMKTIIDFRNNGINESKEANTLHEKKIASIPELYRDEPIKHIEIYNLKYVQCLNYDQVILIQKDLAEAINYAEYGYKYCNCLDPSLRKDLFEKYKIIQSKLDKFYTKSLIYKPYKNLFAKFMQKLSSLKDKSFRLDQKAKRLAKS